MSCLTKALSSKSSFKCSEKSFRQFFQVFLYFGSSLYLIASTRNSFKVFPLNNFPRTSKTLSPRVSLTTSSFQKLYINIPSLVSLANKFQRWQLPFDQSYESFRISVLTYLDSKVSHN